MKKMLIVAAAVAVLVLSSCANVVECATCGEKKPGKTQEIMGVEVSICNDCIKAAEEAMDVFGGLLG